MENLDIYVISVTSFRARDGFYTIQVRKNTLRKKNHKAPWTTRNWKAEEVYPLSSFLPGKALEGAGGGARGRWGRRERAPCSPKGGGIFNCPMDLLRFGLPKSISFHPLQRFSLIQKKWMLWGNKCWWFFFNVRGDCERIIRGSGWTNQDYRG